MCRILNKEQMKKVNSERIILAANRCCAFSRSIQWEISPGEVGLRIVFCVLDLPICAVRTYLELSKHNLERVFS